MSSRNRVSRRSFLKASTSAAGLAAAPLFIPSSAFGANDRILTGHIGVGGMGRGNLGKFLDNAVAVCDVDSKHAANAAKIVLDKKGREVAVFEDYRKLLDRKDIDAVVVSTPDHWHAITTIHACEAGKDVYCEKPLSLTINEGRRMVEAARDNKRIVQTGSMQRSSSNFRRACELVRNGYIGKVHTVHVGLANANDPGKLPPDSKAPENLNYDFWLGPAPVRPYNEKRVHYNFRFWWDYSGGQMTNWGAHHIDIAHWGLGKDDSGPISVHAEQVKYHPEGAHEVPEACRITYDYGDGVKMIVGQGQKDIKMGTRFIGDKGEIYVNRGVFQPSSDEIGAIKLKDSDIHLIDSSNHHKNFLSCMETRELPICDVEIGHRTATACHLGNISCRLERKIEWDPVAEKINGDDEAAELTHRAHRAPYVLG